MSVPPFDEGDSMTQANLTYLRSRARGPLPTRPNAWENFADSVDSACDELETLRHATEFLFDRWDGCQNCVEPHTCESSGRVRDGDGTAEMWCDWCELVARLFPEGSDA